jgi:hypothetical protein
MPEEKRPKVIYHIISLFFPGVKVIRCNNTASSTGYLSAWRRYRACQWLSTLEVQDESLVDNSLIISPSSFSRAKPRALRPSWFVRLGSAPNPRRHSTIRIADGGFPCTARCKGVLPLLSLAVTLALPLSARSLTGNQYPARTAICRGGSPFTSFESGSAPAWRRHRTARYVSREKEKKHKLEWRNLPSSPKAG